MVQMERITGPCAIEFANVSLEYEHDGGLTRALEDVSLCVPEGQFAAIVGPSGCGKTTLLKLAAGLIEPTKGVVSTYGKPVCGPHKNVGMAFQKPVLLLWRTTLQNVMLPLEVAQAHKVDYRKNPTPYFAAAKELLATVGLDGFEDRYPWQLSGGMMQRVSLCRALIHSPQLLLLDEPFGALDAFTREDLWLLLQKLWEQRCCTVFLVTHDLREALFLADIVYVMSQRPGRIVLQQEISTPRPRTLEDCFTTTFTETLHEIRSHIRG